MGKVDNADWHAYYTQKRVVHQWYQVRLLRDLAVRRVLEIGPFKGLVTAMLGNAGYEVSVLDVDDSQRSAFGGVEFISGDVRDYPYEELAGRFDTIICCETLEHMPFDDVDGVLARMVEARARYLIVSVPYMATQLTVDLYVNRHTIMKYLSFKKLRRFKSFAQPPAAAGWQPHKWEVGYKEYPLKRVVALLARHFRVADVSFTAHTRSVFFVCENPLAPTAAEEGAGAP